MHTWLKKELQPSRRRGRPWRKPPPCSIHTYIIFIQKNIYNKKQLQQLQVYLIYKKGRVERNVSDE